MLNKSNATFKSYPSNVTSQRKLFTRKKLIFFFLSFFLLFIILQFFLFKKTQNSTEEINSSDKIKKQEGTLQINKIDVTLKQTLQNNEIDENHLKQLQSFKKSNTILSTITNYQINPKIKELNDKLPVLPFNEYLFQNTPTSTFRYYYFTNKKCQIESSFLLQNKFKPIISVITSFYNTKKDIFLETCQSLLQQTFPFFEWIIINDKSELQKDGIKLLQKSLSKIKINENNKKQIESIYKSNNLKIINLKENVGPGEARNIGMKFLNKHSKYILCLDSDDLLEPIALEKMFLFLFLNHLKVKHKNLQNKLIENKTKPIDLVNSFSMAFSHMNYFHLEKIQLRSHEMIKDNLFPITFLIDRKVMIDKLNGFNATFIKGMEDWDFWIKFLKQGFRAWTIPEIYFWYRLHAPDDRWTFTKTGKEYTEKVNEGKENFRNLHLKKNYKNFYLEKTITQLKKYGYLNNDNSLQNEKRDLLRLWSTVLKEWKTFHFDKKNSLLLITEDLERNKELQYITVEVLKILKLEFNFEVTLLTVDKYFNTTTIDYQPILEKFTTNIFHGINLFENGEKKVLQKMNFLLKYLIISRNINFIINLQSLNGLQLLLNNLSIIKNKHIINYIFTKELNLQQLNLQHKNIKNIISNEYILSTTNKLNNNNPSIIYPSLVSLEDWSFSLQNDDIILQQIPIHLHSIYQQLKTIKTEQQQPNKIIISYWITENNKRRDEEFFSFIKKVLPLKKFKFIFLTNKKLSYEMDLHPEKEKRDINYLRKLSMNARIEVSKFFQVMSEGNSMSGEEDIYFVRPSKQTNVGEMKRSLKIFASLFSDIVWINDSEQLTSQFFQAMAIGNIPLLVVDNVKYENPLLSFVKEYNVGYLLLEQKEEDLWGKLLIEKLKDFKEMKQRNSNLAQTTFNTKTFCHNLFKSVNYL